MVCYGFFGLWLGMWGALLPSIQQRTGAGNGGLAAVLFVAGLAPVPTPLLAAPLLQRLGWAALPATLCVLAISVTAVGAATSVISLGCALVVASVAGACLDILVNAIVISEEQSRGRPLMQAVHGVWPLAYIVGGLMAGTLRSAAVEPPVILLLVTVPMLLFGAASRAAFAGRSAKVSAFPLLRNRMVLALGMIGLLAYAVESGIQGWGAIHLSSTFGSGPFVAALAPVALGLTQAFGRAAAHRTSMGLAPSRAMVLAVPIAVIGITLTAAAPSAALALLGIAIIGLGIATWAPGLFTLAGHLGEGLRRPETIAAVTTITYCGLFLGPAMVGVIASVAGLRWGIAMLSLAALTFGAAVHLRGAHA